VEAIEKNANIDIPNDLEKRVRELSKNKKLYSIFKRKINFKSKKDPTFNLTKFK